MENLSNAFHLGLLENKSFLRIAIGDIRNTGLFTQEHGFKQQPPRLVLELLPQLEALLLGQLVAVLRQVH